MSSSLSPWRALTRNEASGCYHNPNLSKLIAVVDAFEGEPTAADIARLADRYGDLPSMVRHLFETRADRPRTSPAAPPAGPSSAGWLKVTNFELADGRRRRRWPLSLW